MKNDKYTLTDEELKNLLLVTSVKRGVRWEIDDIEENEHETESSFDGKAGKASVEQYKDDEIRG